MAWISFLLKAIVLLPAFLVLNNAINLLRNYIAARQFGGPIQVIPMRPMDLFWSLIDNRVLTHVRQLPVHLGDNHFTSWDLKHRSKPRQKMGTMWTLVTPSYNFVYLSDPELAASTYMRQADLAKPTFISR